MICLIWGIVEHRVKRLYRSLFRYYIDCFLKQTNLGIIIEFLEGICHFTLFGANNQISIHFLGRIFEFARMNSSACRRGQGLKTVAARGRVNGRGPQGEAAVGGMEEQSSGSFSNPVPGGKRTEENRFPEQVRE